jgi:broad specificity phosphatase PhoE
MGAEKVTELRALRIDGLPRYRAVDAASADAKVLHLIRHGEATHNVQPKPWGEDLVDARLTDTGVQQALALRERAATLPVEVVVVSPLSRALETATRGLEPLIVRQPPVPFICVEECREQFGKNLPDMRRPIAAVAIEYPQVSFETLPQLDADPLFTPERETLEALTRRADQFLDLMWARPEKHIAVVTHSSFLAALLNAALDVSSAPESAGWFDNAELRSVWVGRRDAQPQGAA